MESQQFTHHFSKRNANVLLSFSFTWKKERALPAVKWKEHFSLCHIKHFSLKEIGRSKYVFGEAL